jgi:ribonuclease PH
MTRIDYRKLDELRPVNFITDFVDYPEGSVLISCGNTKVLCNATIEDGVPRWIDETGRNIGWVTSEYSMLPRSTHTRKPRELSRPSGRSQEIKRLIGRSLRASIDLQKLGNRTCIIDCDVIQADGGTRTASITGGYVALEIALSKLIHADTIPHDIFKTAVAAVSVGVVDGNPMLDLCYEEDSKAQVDLNVVMNANGDYIDIQGTAEKHPFSRESLDDLLKLATDGISRLISFQETLISNSA